MLVSGKTGQSMCAKQGVPMGVAHLDDHNNPEFGSRMPLRSAPLTAAQPDSIRTWILRGALADEAPPGGQ